MPKLYILDIDGTLVVTKSGGTFRKSADDWQWLPGRLEKCKALRADGALFAIATNQAGVAFPWSKFTEAEMQAEIEKVAREIDAGFVAVCYTTPNEKALFAYYNPNDLRRKPGPAMLLEAMTFYQDQIDPGEVVMIGDRVEDRDAAEAASVAFIAADIFFDLE